jgi:hypothetical protein
MLLSADAAASSTTDGGEGKAAWGEGLDSGASSEVIPTKSAMATSEEAYAEVGGEVAALAIAAVRSGEYTESQQPGSPAQPGLPPPPPIVQSEEVSQEPSLTSAPAVTQETAEAETALPAGWIQVTDEASGQPYFFNESSGVSVWDRKECV